MDSRTVTELRSFTLKARELLTREVSEQLEGIYGLLPSGVFNLAEDYPVLQEIPEASATREQIETLLAEEEAAGLKPKAAREKLIKEAAFTWLNRLVAFKMMEGRKLLRQAITKEADSNGFKMWLTEVGNESNLADYEAGDLPQDGLGEGPRQRAYRRFLLAQCERLAREVRVLFDPDNLASRFFPRPQVLSSFIELLNADILEDAWKPGHEETIGWVYQYFVEEEKAAVFFRLYKEKKKVRREEIPAATQIFTPNWMVRCLVQNTLGRLWIQMHPDSNLGQKLDYLIPLQDSVPNVFLKPACEILILDPACGTMHFGLVAFDLLVEMYREEIERQGEPGWPEKASVQSGDEIPSSILENNLHGIDVDLRATQLSALALFLRARTVSPSCEIRNTRLACGDIHMLSGDRLKEFLDTIGLSERPIYGRILSALQSHLADAEQLGSLVRLDDQIHLLVADERRKYQRDGHQEDFIGWSDSQFETEAGEREFWEMLEIQIEQALSEFGRQQAREGNVLSFFSNEATKGLRLLEVMQKRYDIVVTNPPYMTSRNMNHALKSYLQKHYPLAKSDLYAAFIQRCSEWLSDGGRLGILSQQSFMFISSYKKLRQFLRNLGVVETLPHVGPKAFEAVTGEKVNATLLVFRREAEECKRDDGVGTYFRLVKEPDGDAKRRRFETALRNLRDGKHDPIVFRYRQGDLDAISGAPWVYWITQGVRNIFGTHSTLEEVAKPRQGLATADNSRFLRYWWESGKSQIALDYENTEQASNTDKKWFPYMKGGSFKRWYGNQEFCIKWENKGGELYANRPISVIRNPGFYFRRGVTYSYLTSGTFCARVSPGGFIFDVAGSSLFPDNPHLVLGILNSRFAFYALRLINPTVNFQVGDLSRLPVSTNGSEELTSLVNRAIELARLDSEENEATYDFIAPPDWPDGIERLQKRRAELARVESGIDEEVYRLYGVSEEDRRAIEAELATSESDDADSADDAGETVDEISDDLKTSSVTRQELAKQWIAYALGVVLGRFQPGVQGALGCGRFTDAVAEKLRVLTDLDGVLVIDEGHEDDIAVKVLHALSVIHGSAAARVIVAEATDRDGDTEEELRRWFERGFFKEHIRLYRKRPVYWFLQSPKKKYGVWGFHEKLTGDTLYRVQGKQYLQSKIALLENQQNDLWSKHEPAEGRERKRLESEIADIDETLDDLREFSKRIAAIVQRGYERYIDDGVLISMAPLWELFPSWQAEPKKCWQALEAGKFDWSHQAMDHWPDRVKQKCAENRSYAIAHGLEE